MDRQKACGGTHLLGRGQSFKMEQFSPTRLMRGRTLRRRAGAVGFHRPFLTCDSRVTSVASLRSPPAGPPGTPERASHCARSFPSSQLPQEGAWDDAPVPVLPRAPASGAALAGTAAAAAGEAERKKGRGAGKACRRAEGRWRGTEKRGRE